MQIFDPTRFFFKNREISSHVIKILYVKGLVGILLCAYSSNGLNKASSKHYYGMSCLSWPLRKHEQFAVKIAVISIHQVCATWYPSTFECLNSSNLQVSTWPAFLYITLVYTSIMYRSFNDMRGNLSVLEKNFAGSEICKTPFTFYTKNTFHIFCILMV